MEELIKKGDTCLENKDYIKAINYYLEYLDIEDNNYIKLKLCYIYILIKDYESAFYYFINCYIIEDDYINIDYNLGIFLFSMLIDLPNEYLNTVKNMQLSDVEILEDDLGYQDITRENNIRLLIINQSFSHVKDILDKKIDFTNTIYNLIIKELINNIVEFQIEINKYLLNLIKNKDYQEIIIYLESIESKRKINKNNQYILTLVKELIKVKETLEVSSIVNFKTDSLYEAIDCKNYKLALQIYKEYCYKNHLDRNKEIIFLLLDEIVKEIDAIKEVDLGINILDIDLGDTLSFTDINFETHEINPKEVVNNIIKYLNENELANLYQEIDEFLKNINKLEYRFLIIDIIKLAYEEQNLSLINDIVEKLSNKTFKFKLGFYINNFYISLENKEYRKSRIYLDIIKNAWRIGYEIPMICNLENVLNKYDDSRQL